MKKRILAVMMTAAMVLGALTGCGHRNIRFILLIQTF